MIDDGKNTNQLADLPQDPRRVFGERLAALREQAALSQQAVADAVGVSRPMVSQWESGSYPGGEFIVPLADLLQVSAAELMLGRVEKGAGGRKADPILVAKAMVARVVRRAVDQALASIESTEDTIQRAAGAPVPGRASKGKGRRR